MVESTVAVPEPPDTALTVRQRLAFLATPGWLGTMAGAVVFAIACFTILAPWQFGRHEQRAAQNAAVISAVSAGPVALEQLLPAGPDGDVGPEKVWRSVSATGVYLADRQVVVGLRQDNTGLGAGEVLTPLQLADGSILLVDRGYVALAGLANGAKAPDPPGGTVSVVGRLQPFQPDPLNRPAQRVGQRIEVRGIDATSIPNLPGPVRRGFIQLADDAPGVLDPIGLPQVDSGPFLSYAWQWISFGTMGILAVIFFAVREFRDPRPPVDLTGDDANQPDPGTPPPTPGERPSRRKFDRSELYDP